MNLVYIYYVTSLLGEKKAKAEAARLRKQLSDQGSQLRNERTNFTIELRELRETMTSEVDSRKKVEYAYAEYKQRYEMVMTVCNI